MAGLTAGIATAPALSGSAEAQSSSGAIPQRSFGRHPDKISVLGVGGHHLGNAATVGEATAIVHEAVDSGINFFDNAWEYNDHRSEECLGAALRGGYRSRAFLMTKVCTHGRDASRRHDSMLEESLRRLRHGSSRPVADPRGRRTTTIRTSRTGTGGVDRGARPREAAREGASTSALPVTRTRTSTSACSISATPSTPFSFRSTPSTRSSAASSSSCSRKRCGAGWRCSA